MDSNIRVGSFRLYRTVRSLYKNGNGRLTGPGYPQLIFTEAYAIEASLTSVSCENDTTIIGTNRGDSLVRQKPSCIFGLLCQVRRFPVQNNSSKGGVAQ